MCCQVQLLHTSNLHAYPGFREGKVKELKALSRILQGLNSKEGWQLLFGCRIGAQEASRISGLQLSSRGCETFQSRLPRNPPPAIRSCKKEACRERGKAGHCGHCHAATRRGSAFLLMVEILHDAVYTILPQFQGFCSQIRQDLYHQP